jgi:hypothetical protein
MLKYIAIALLLASCSSSPPKTVEAPSAAPVVPVASLAAVEKPALPTCTRRYVALDLDIFNQCILDGMSVEMVSNIIGFAGTPVSSSGAAIILRWGNGNGGVMMATFVNDRLTAKAQNGLEACVRNCP